MVFQKEIILSPYSRGFHLITSKIINHIPKVSGIAHLFIKHTSASLTLMRALIPPLEMTLKRISTIWYLRMKIIILIFLREPMI